MKTKISLDDVNVFWETIDKVIESNYFNIDDAEVLTEAQEDALDEHGDFLSLVPRDDYAQVAFNVLQAFYHYNLSTCEGKYRFESCKLKPQERNAVQEDIKRAREYWTTLSTGKLSRIVALQICELKAYLKHREAEAPGIIELHEYRLIDPNRYDRYRLPDKYTKKDIEAVLLSITKKYDLEGFTNNILKIKNSH